MDGEGRGKTAGTRQFVFRLQFSCAASQFEIGVHDLERQLCHIIQDFLRDPTGLRIVTPATMNRRTKWTWSVPLHIIQTRSRASSF